MNDESLLKKSLLMIGKLVGVFSVWVALLSFLAVSLAGRVGGGASSASADKAPMTAGETSKKDETATPRAKTPPANGTNKPNG